MKFLITRTCQYTETLTVDAETEDEARGIGDSSWEDFERNNDDSIIRERIDPVIGGEA